MILDYIFANKSKFAGQKAIDLGCGEAEFHERLKTKEGFRIFSDVVSVDLVPNKEFVRVCDIADLPFKDEEFGCAVLCLALMGTNFGQFIQETSRVVKIGGHILIAEVSSRFTNENKFLENSKKTGLDLVLKRDLSSYFKFFVFKKRETVSKLEVDWGGVLKACVYKKR